MIRAITISSLVTVLMLVLYLPSSQTPERFLSQLRLEHERNLAFWGEPTAERIFDRMLRLRDQALALSPVPNASNSPNASHASNASNASNAASLSNMSSAAHAWSPSGAPEAADTGNTRNDANETMTVRTMSPVLFASATQRGVTPAVEQEMARVNARLFDNSYFRSIEALFALASYRLEYTDQIRIICVAYPSLIRV